MLKIEPAKWSDYKRFVNLCCVQTMPYHGGPCWTVENDIAFIGFNFCYRNNRQRNLIWPEHSESGKRFDMKWLNQNIRCLNRVMVRPNHRGKGIATQLVKQTLPMVGVPFVECLTFAELIKNILLSCDFEEYGSAKSGSCKYYLWRGHQKGPLDLNHPTK